MNKEEIKKFATEQVQFLAGEKERMMTIEQIATVVEIAVTNLKNKGLLK